MDELGDGVDGVSIGDPIFGTSMLGGTAEEVVLSAWAPIPATLTVEQAAGAGFAGITAVVIANAFETDSHRGAPYVPCPELPWQDWTLETYFLYASSKITSSE